MATYSLLDDQPVTSASADHTGLGRYLEALDISLLKRPPVRPHVVGLFGPWGTGKSSLLNLIEKRLVSDEPLVTGKTRTYADQWLCVRFSPWTYRNEQSLLMPLLATIAKANERQRRKDLKASNHPWHVRWNKYFGKTSMQQLVDSFIDKGAKLAGTVAKTTPGVNVVSEPLLAFLLSLRKRGPTKELGEQVKFAVDEMRNPPRIFQRRLTRAVGASTLRVWRGIERPWLTNLDHAAQKQACERIRADRGKLRNRSIAFLIDDLDRCPESKQVINLLEQIKLFLDLPHCVFFIAADRGQIIRAIDEVYKGAGESYLEKFVQTAVYIERPAPENLVNILNLTPAAEVAPGDPHDQPLIDYMKQVAALLDFNPRKIKRLWNEAVQRYLLLTGPNAASIDIRLIVKSILLHQCPEVVANPASYLDIERMVAGSTIGEKALIRQKFTKKLGLAPNSDDVATHAQGKKALVNFLWDDTSRLPFGGPTSFWMHFCQTIPNWQAPIVASANLTLPAITVAAKGVVGQTVIANSSLNDTDFTGAQLIGARIHDIPSMLGTNFTRADLSNATFEKCNLAGAIFDDANLTGTQFINSSGYGGLLGNTKAETLIKIIERAFSVWQSDTPPPINMELFHACVELTRMPENQALAAEASDLASRIRERFAEIDSL